VSPGDIACTLRVMICETVCIDLSLQAKRIP
jgi:hypothetical protein